MHTQVVIRPRHSGGVKEMEINEFQRLAFETDESKRTTVSLFGLAGEVGSIFSAFKKRVRDRRNVAAFREELIEELGDALWYIASIASLSEIKLEEVAESNIKKARSLFEDKAAPDFDSKYPANEQIPRHMRIRFSLDRKTGRSQMYWEEGEIGAPLSDNSDEEDYYRFHDVFHLSFMTFLGWSPVIRTLLKRKRKSVRSVDENEDGARAAITEEAVSAIVFNFAEDNDFFVEIRSISFGLLKIISRLCRKFEVRACSARQWQQAIWHGSQVYRELVQNAGGIVELDRDERRITYVSPPTGTETK